MHGNMVFSTDSILPRDREGQGEGEGGGREGETDTVWRQFIREAHNSIIKMIM